MPGLSTATGGLLALAIIAQSSAFRAIESRRLLGRLNDPLLPERLFASRKRTSTVATLSAAVLGAAAPRLVLVSLPLLLIANAAAGFRLRRTLYEESWGFPAFLSFHTRLFIGVYGFWLLLFALPITAGAFGTRLLAIPLALAVVLLAWEYWHARALRTLMRARPIQDETLLRAFDDLVARTGLPRPAFEVATPEGGTVVNALALPASSGSAVLFSATLLERFELDEIVAVCAHELAHLEYYDVKRLAQYRWATCGLILLGATAIPALARLAPPMLAILGWAAAFLAAIALRVRHRQRNETVSDCRAVELTGDPDAMARDAPAAALRSAVRAPRDASQPGAADPRPLYRGWLLARPARRARGNRRRGHRHARHLR
jgi:Zn-dependent protease with chaperone function